MKFSPDLPADQHQTLQDVIRQFTYMGIPCFPIRITWDEEAGKYQKRPLTEHGHLDASTTAEKFNTLWPRSNGAGFVMGGGYYCLDADTHKDGAMERIREWTQAYDIPQRTRTHRTPSGGWHFLYRLPPDWPDLRTRSNVVTGLDTRGKGGWIAFGAGYTIHREVGVADLPRYACQVLHDGSDGPAVANTVISREIKGYTRPDGDMDAKLTQALLFGPRQLRFRWKGNTIGLIDKSRSGLDHSVAKLLALHGWDQNEIAWALLERFQHGSAAAKAQPGVALRAAMRSAVKGRVSTDDERMSLLKFKDTTLSDDMEAALLARIRGEEK